MSGSLDLIKGITTIWVSNGIDWQFKQWWPVADRTRYPSLNDKEGTPGQPFPYCVLEFSGPGRITERMSGANLNNQYIHDVPISFNIHMDQGTHSKTPKEIIALLVDELLKNFGGHPSIAAPELELDNGCHLITQYITDFGERTSDVTWMWTVLYLFRIDIPVAT